MKKFLLSAGLLLSSGMVCAENDVITDADVAVVEQSDLSHKGWNAYIGLGIGGSFLENKGDVDGKNIKFDKQTVNRFMGTITLGIGRFFENGAYLGLEFLTDFGKSTSKDIQINGRNVHSEHTGALSPLGIDQELTGKVKNQGVYPELALKFGYKYNCCLLYAKFGGRYSKITYDLNIKQTDHGTATTPINPARIGNQPYNTSKSNIVPTIALGTEFKKGKFGLFGEVEYCFRQKNDFDFSGDKYKTKCSEGWLIRGGAIYSVSF